MTELLDITATSFFPAEHREALDARMRPLADVTRGVAARHGALLVPDALAPGVRGCGRLQLGPPAPQRARARDRRDRGVRVLGDALALRQGRLDRCDTLRGDHGPRRMAPAAYEAWEPTKQTLHRYTQIVGKVRMALVPPRNHWWHVTLYVTPGG
jgi:hypothetical protein